MPWAQGTCACCHQETEYLVRRDGRPTTGNHVLKYIRCAACRRVCPQTSTIGKPEHECRTLQASGG